MILVAKQYTAKQVERAQLKASEFKVSRYTTGSANLDDMIALGKAVILCESHARKFDPRLARYCKHPAKNLERVHGACDYCREVSLSWLFVNEVDAFETRRKLARYRRAQEYARL